MTKTSRKGMVERQTGTRTVEKDLNVTNIWTLKIIFLNYVQFLEKVSGRSIWRIIRFLYDPLNSYYFTPIYSNFLWNYLIFNRKELSWSSSRVHPTPHNFYLSPSPPPPNTLHLPWKFKTFLVVRYSLIFCKYGKFKDLMIFV